MGYATVSVADGDLAWKAFQESPAQIVVADWLMPGVDGLELCRRVRERTDDQCFVIILTSRDGHDDLQLALAAGADHYPPTPNLPAPIRARLLVPRPSPAIPHARPLP